MEPEIPGKPDPSLRRMLEAIRHTLTNDGFYAYLTLTDDQEWAVAVDDISGHVDVLARPERIHLDVWGSSPGLFAEEESAWRLQALERLAKRVVPNVARGFLEPNQHAEWSAEEQGVRVRISYDLDPEELDQLGSLIRSIFPEVEKLLVLVESELRT